MQRAARRSERTGAQTSNVDAPGSVIRRVSLWSEAGLLVAGYLGYRLASRAIVENDQALEHAGRILRFEKTAWFFVEPDLQQPFLHSTLLRETAWLVSQLLWLPFLLVTLGWLMKQAPAAYRHLRNALGISALLALAIAWLLPTAPPRTLPVSGVADLFGAAPYPRLLPAESTAMPALFAGWVIAAGAVLFVILNRGRRRWFVWVPVLVTLLTFVISGDHFLLDLVVGAVVTLVPLAIVWNQARFRAWWSRWLVPAPGSPTAIESLRNDRPAWLAVAALALLLLYLCAGWLIDPGFTDYWAYMVVQIVATIAAVIWLTHRFGAERGLHSITLLIVVLVTWLDTLGTAAGFYTRFDVYDKITHTGGGAILAASALDLLTSLWQRGAITWRRSRRITLAISVSVLLGATWELYEFAGDLLFHTGRHAGRFDTLYDLISDSAGAILAALLIDWAYHRHGPPVSGAGDDGTPSVERPVTERIEVGTAVG